MLNDIVLDSVSNQLNLTSSQSSINNHGLANNNSNSPINQNEKESKECLNTTNLVSNLKSRAFSSRLDLLLEEVIFIFN